MEGRTYANNEKLTFSPFAVPRMLHCTWPPFHGGAVCPLGLSSDTPRGHRPPRSATSTRYPARSVRLRLLGQGIKKAQPTRWRFVRCLGVEIPPQVCAPLWKRPITATGGGVAVTPLSGCGITAPARG